MLFQLLVVFMVAEQKDYVGEVDWEAVNEAGMARQKGNRLSKGEHGSFKSINKIHNQVAQSLCPNILLDDLLKCEYEFLAQCSQKSHRREKIGIDLV